MSDTIYADIAPALLTDVWPIVAIGGPTWTRTRRSGGGSSGPGSSTTTANVGPIYLLPNGAHPGQTAVGVGVYDTDYLIGADETVDIRAGDTFSDGTTTFQVKGSPDVLPGFQLAPAEVIRNG